jgi:hypothetical protein
MATVVVVVLASRVDRFCTTNRSPAKGGGGGGDGVGDMPLAIALHAIAYSSTHKRSSLVFSSHHW